MARLVTRGIEMMGSNPSSAFTGSIVKQSKQSCKQSFLRVQLPEEPHIPNSTSCMEK